MNLEVFEFFNNGQLRLPDKTISFVDINWSKHPVFEGVELKHIITSKDTNGEYSYHLVRIAPNKSILDHIHETQLETHEVIAGEGTCINDGNELVYEPGVISMNYPHPTMSDGVSVMPLCGMNLQDIYILQNRACPLCPYPIGSPLGILFLRYLLLR